MAYRLALVKVVDNRRSQINIAQDNHLLHLNSWNFVQHFPLLGDGENFTILMESRTLVQKIEDRHGQPV